MKTAFFRTLPLLLLLSLNTILFAQSQYSIDDKKAIKMYEDAITLIDVNRQWDRGIFTLEKAIERDPNFVEAHLKLADMYKKFNRDQNINKKVVKHYEKVVELQPDNKRYASTYLKLASIYYEDSKYQEAMKLYDQVRRYPLITERIKQEATLGYESCVFADYAMSHPYDIEPKELSLNQYHTSQYHPVMTADMSSMIYTVRDRGSDEDILISNYQNGEWSVPEPLKAINTEASEGMASISADGKTLVFTGCNRADGVGSCDLYISYKRGGNWSKPQNLKTVNSKMWESEPSLSADGRYIYFTSSRSGGFGGRDLWVASKNEKGEWEEAKNCGPVINTPGDDVTPFIHADGNTLYFSTNGRLGMGGYDVFYTHRLNNSWDIPMNMGYPINTADNEGSFYITPDYSLAYYDKGGFRHSNLFYFELPEEIRSKFRSFYAKGIVFDANSEEKLNAEIELIDLNTEKTIQMVESDSVNGDYLLVLTEGHEYALHVRKNGYFFYSQHLDFEAKESLEPIKLDIGLLPINTKKPITLHNIFFESGSFKLKKKSSVELDRLINVLESNPTVNIEILGHTDNVGSSSANQTLSLNRAKSVYNYLLDQGIAPSRLKYKGYGQSKPIASNDSEEGRKKNRRIEFQIF